jgi:hypothetical protein
MTPALRPGKGRRFPPSVLSVGFDTVDKSAVTAKPLAGTTAAGQAVAARGAFLPSRARE